MTNGHPMTSALRREPGARRRAGLPAEATNLSQSELALMRDPDWVTEDDADAIIAKRRRREKPIPLEQALKKIWTPALS